MDEAMAVASNALQTANRIDESESSRAFAYVSVALARVGKIAEAQAAMGKIDISKYLPWPQAEVAAALAQAGRIREAIKLELKNRSSGEPDQRAWRAIAEHLGPELNLDEALALLNSPGQKARFLADCATRLSRQGEGDEARKLLSQAHSLSEAITEDEEKSKILARIAEAWAQMLEFYRAKQIANLCARADDKLFAYIAILREHSTQQTKQ